MRDRHDYWVHETRFGIWFQSTWMWRDYVLRPAIDELERLLGPHGPVGCVLDAGCGDGAALAVLRERFQPRRLVAVDIDPGMITRAAARAAQADAELRRGDVRKLELADASVDLVFCHQTLHHVSDPETALHEFHRVLAPGGVLLISESCRRFTRLLWVRLFFRHPIPAQRSAAEYVDMLRRAGFALDEARVSNPSPPWARPGFGFIDRWRASRRKPVLPTQLAAAAVAA